MAKARISGTKKRRQRPEVGSVGIMLHLPPDLLADLDRWIQDIARRMRAEPTGRPEAIRDILQNHVDTQRQHREDVQRAKSRANKRAQSAEIAGRTVDEIADQSAAIEDRAQRKGHLLKGPEEFRAIRRDSLKPRKR
jgi:hypothetical protein